MTRYHFNMSGIPTGADEEGTELPSLQHAQGEAVRLFGAILVERSAVDLGKDLRLEMTDGAGVVLLRMAVAITASAAP